MPKFEDACNITPQWVLSGDATFTVSNGQGEHKTFKVYKAKAKDGWDPAWFIKLMWGSDNESDYSYLGMLVLPRTDHGEPKIKLTGRSRWPADHAYVRIANWAIRVIWQQAQGKYQLPPGYSIKHDGHCGRCGAKLTNPASIDTGLGPECAAQAGVEWREHATGKSSVLDWETEQDVTGSEMGRA